MKKIYPLIILLLLIAFTVLYIEKPSGYQQQTERLENVIREGKKEADSLRSSLLNAIDTIEVQRLIIANAHEATERAHQETQKWIKRYNFEKSIRLGIKTESEYDSILSVLYPK